MIRKLSHRSGDGVSALRLAREPGLEEDDDNGHCMGLNSCAFAFNRRGDDKDEAGRLAANCAWEYVA